MTAIQRLRTVLASVPHVLLETEDRRVLSDTLVSLAALSSIDDPSLEDLNGQPNPMSRQDVERSAVLRASAVSGAKYIARAVTLTSTEIGSLSDTVNHCRTQEVRGSILPVLETWPTTRSALTTLAGGLVDDLDDAVVSDGPVHLAANIRSEIGTWFPSQFDTRLDAWRDQVIDDFASLSNVRWRKRSAAETIERASWRAAINADVSASRKLERVMGDELRGVRDDGRAKLDAILDAVVIERRAAWREQVDELGAYAPGDLLAAADGLETGASQH